MLFTCPPSLRRSNVHMLQSGLFSCRTGCDASPRTVEGSVQMQDKLSWCFSGSWRPLRAMERRKWQAGCFPHPSSVLSMSPLKEGEGKLECAGEEGSSLPLGDEHLILRLRLIASEIPFSFHSVRSSSLQALYWRGSTGAFL